MSRTRAAVLVLSVLVLAGAAVELCYGAKAIPVGRVVSVLADAVWPDSETTDALSAEQAPVSPAEAELALDRMIVLNVRMPRLLLAILVGGALALAGAVMQAVFHNPMADPYLLGVANGGALGAVIAINTGLAATTFLALPIAALLGGLAAALAVYLIAMSIGRLSPLTLILSGLALGFLLSSATLLVLVLSNQWNLHEGLFWIMGSLKNRTWEHVAIAGPVVVLGSSVLLAFGRELDILMMGDHGAAALGVSVGRMRLVLLALAAVVTAVSVSAAGVIGFVGLMVPHLMRLIVGPLSRRLLPVSFLAGAAFLLLADLLARAVTETLGLHMELQLGIISSFLGVPVFLYLLRRSTQRV